MHLHFPLIICVVIAFLYWHSTQPCIRMKLGISYGNTPIRPPFLYASIRHNGGGLCTGSWHCHVTTITVRQLPWHTMSALSQAVWWIKQERNDKVSLDMTQVVGILTAVVVFTCLSIWTVVRVGGGLMHETKILVQEFRLKMGAGRMHEGLRMGGILWYIKSPSD